MTRMMTKEACEDTFLSLMREAGLPTPERHHRSDELRYGVDFAWPAAQIAVEVDANETRYLRAAKLNHLALAGWLVLYFTGLMLTTNGPAVIKSVRRALEIKTGQPWPASDGHADRMD